jgi:hypothetical protein
MRVGYVQEPKKGEDSIFLGRMSVKIFIVT